MSHLRSISADGQDYEVVEDGSDFKTDTDIRTDIRTDTKSGLPEFEGEPVTDARFKLTSVGDLEAPDKAVRIDDVVKMFVEGRVVRVDHVVDEKTGRLRRVQTIKAVDAIQLPWEVEIDDFR